MDVKIGIKNSARELSFDSSQSAADVYAEVSNALSTGAKTIKFSDSKGRLFVVPADSLAYIEIGAEESRRVGFIA
jgi:hypothetical protein